MRRRPTRAAPPGRPDERKPRPVVLFEVDKKSDLPPWLQLRNRLAYLIATGYFKPGEKLPTVRGLAAEISINFNTVNKAYISLMDEGYIESRPGKGTIVREISPEKSEKLESVDTLIEDCVDACLAMGLDFDDVSKRIKKKIHDMERERGND
ncbi:GntR family transcriptional regulator [Enterorhabdus sp. P55]|nr:GntR family transcriptional regulator [Enterorhabdus sp. P55]